MSGVKDGTCRDQSVVCKTRGFAVLLCGLLCGVTMAVSGCQTAPTFRGQSLGFDDRPPGKPPTSNIKRARRVDEEPLPEEEMVPDGSAEGLPLSDDSPEELNDPITDIVIEGNETIETSAIRKLIHSPIARPPAEQQIREDVRALYSTRWFFSVEPRYRRNEKGLVLVFRVIERPMVQKVEYRGNERIKTKHLEKLTGLREGSPFDVSVNREAIRRIEEHYKTKGFPYTKVNLLKGNQREDRQVIFDIQEGPKVIVGAVNFTGNDSFSAALLKTKLSQKPAILGLAFLGKYKPELLPDDVSSLKQYYHSLGYFDAEIEKEVDLNEHPLNPLSYKSAHAIVTYHIKEGPRFKIRNLIMEGNQIFSTDELSSDMKLRSGDQYNARFMNKDVEAIKDRYGKLGRTFANVEPIPRFLEEPGTMDLVYHVNEDQVYTIRHINVHISGDNPHTREAAVRHRVLTHPGDLADPKKIAQSKRRLEGQLFERAGPNAPSVNISKVEEKQPKSRSQLAQTSRAIRGQSPDSPNSADDTTAASTLDTTQFMLAQADPATHPFGGGSTDPLQFEPPPAQLDLDYTVTETQTGSLSFGVGVNSNSGLVGSIVLQENNFDITRFPTSFDDFRNGTAFRGAGQQFRAEAVPGNIVSRYLVSWTDPYFLDTDYSVGVNGFYWKRFYRDWTEERVGGRVNGGRQLTQEFSVLGSVRMESITLTNPTTPTPDILQRAVGNTFLSSARIGVAHDTRDSQFLPGEGHYLVAGFEQAFGTFTYPRADGEAHQYFTVYSRPDGGGRHIVSLGMSAAWTGKDTPIFERYFAGGFQSFRGFQFRGVSPKEGKVYTGGQWMFLAGAEYMIPLTADEMIAAVAFTDIGTVEDKIGFNRMRATVGAGLRITVPMMGPAPIALDWGIPILKEKDDLEKFFSFSVGFTR